MTRPFAFPPNARRSALRQWHVAEEGRASSARAMARAPPAQSISASLVAALLARRSTETARAIDLGRVAALVWNAERSGSA